MMTSPMPPTMRRGSRDSLKRLNFEVATGINLPPTQMDELFRRYEPKLSAYSAVLIFYAGHGIQIKGENYLLPVDTLDPESVEKLTERAIKLNDVISRFASRDRQTFIFLDACRNSPLGSGTGGAGDGLAQVEVGENSFIAFATQPGNVTVDGSGSNSPFTSALLQSLEFPGLSISDMMIRVRNETERLTLGKQVPWDQSNLREQFYFTEQQVIDSRELSATLNRILEVPSMKEKLLVQLASADTDLQSTVLLLGRQLPTLRSVDASPTQEPAGQQVASLELGRERKTVASDIERFWSWANRKSRRTMRRPSTSIAAFRPSFRVWMLSSADRRRMGSGFATGARRLSEAYQAGWRALWNRVSNCWATCSCARGVSAGSRWPRRKRRR